MPTRASWEKGRVEHLVGDARRTSRVPIAQVTSLEALNALLRQRGLEDQQRVLAGQTAPRAEPVAVEQRELGP